jgi:hypothetical protein
MVCQFVMKPNHLRKRPHKLFGSIFKRAVQNLSPFSRSFCEGALYASTLPRQLLSKSNLEKTLLEQLEPVRSELNHLN